MGSCENSIREAMKRSVLHASALSNQYGSGDRRSHPSLSPLTCKLRRPSIQQSHCSRTWTLVADLPLPAREITRNCVMVHVPDSAFIKSVTGRFYCISFCFVQLLQFSNAVMNCQALLDCNDFGQILRTFYLQSIFCKQDLFSQFAFTFSLYI